MTKAPSQSRIQKKNRLAILDGALAVFSTHGFGASSLDQIAAASNLSKPNILYYFKSKEAIHQALLSGLIDTWMSPLRALSPDGDPLDEILAYVQRKLAMSRDYPRESRLFASEMLHGAPHMRRILSGDLKTLVDEKALLISAWSDTGAIARVNPYHLIFSIWSLTQHYADFDSQVRVILGPDDPDPFPEAQAYLEHLFRRTLAP